MGENQRVARVEDMATTSTAVATIPSQLQEAAVEPVAVITLRPRNKERKKVVWTEDTVDNEHMNKKKSKCCCIYEKPHKFGESDSEDSDDECEHCFGHVEKRKAKHAGPHETVNDSAGTCTIQETAEPEPQEPTTTITLHPSEPSPAPAPPDNNGSTAQ